MTLVVAKRVGTEVELVLDGELDAHTAASIGEASRAATKDDRSPAVEVASSAALMVLPFGAASFGGRYTQPTTAPNPTPD